ncbi:PREDICTED: peptidyl-prolyl cis-trans isomerase E [Brassica oleracea var. oleracea]|uniref:peptidyl-prolyl cis-trans isomerase E n=1 Tax=Brassica oleracea var. oleracea TaxID=109376 RepID=UPI0006A6B941|nr:PREDICTED: peptidyl-prolyl cis-trans isomerase E [Brassica oleracea var. oleracea]
MAAVQQQQAMQKNTLYVGGLADEVNESILHAAFIPFGDIKDVKTPLDQANQKHRSFGFVTFLEREDASAAMDNMDGAELYGRVLTVNYALPEKIKGGEQGWAAHPLWADADTWFERQQQEKEILKIQAENKAAMEAAEELHRKKLAQDRQGEMEEDTDVKDDPMARAEAENYGLVFARVVSHYNFIEFEIRLFYQVTDYVIVIVTRSGTLLKLS